jgi:hypothetical protein
VAVLLDRLGHSQQRLKREEVGAEIKQFFNSTLNPNFTEKLKLQRTNRN